MRFLCTSFHAPHFTEYRCYNPLQSGLYAYAIPNLTSVLSGNIRHDISDYFP